MAISLITVGGKITAALINALIGAVNQTAMSGVIPTSVAGTGVTATPNGSVTFTNATSISVNGVFSGTYDNYRIAITTSTRSAANGINFRLRQAGTDVTTSNYDWVRSVASGTTMTVSSSSAGTAAALDTGLGVGQVSSTVLDLTNPAAAVPCLGTGLTSILYSGALTSATVSLANESTSSSDGFTIYPIGGATTVTGVLRVYGYNNLT